MPSKDTFNEYVAIYTKSITGLHSVLLLIFQLFFGNLKVFAVVNQSPFVTLIVLEKFSVSHTEVHGRE